ncbi:MAG: FecCD family ABC transporter permease [Eubacteriales bacterium]
MKRRTAAVGTVLVLLLAAAIYCGLRYGSVDLSFSRIVEAMRGNDKSARVILLDLRLPRMLSSLLGGAGLACAGLILQTITDNDLCAPNIIGVNSGAGLAVMITLSLFPMAWRYLPLSAFLGAALVTFVVLTISRFGGSYEQKSTLVLAGVAVSSVMSAGISFLSLKYPDVLSSYTAFSVGGFSGVKMQELPLPAAIIASGIILSYIFAPKIGLLSLGDDTASSLGVSVRRVFILSIVIASALSAAVVSFAGLLGFVGLIVPHIVRRLVGSDFRRCIPFSAGFGAVLCAFSDVIGRVIIAPNELPAGIIMSLIGAPFFIFLLVKRRRAR